MRKGARNSVLDLPGENLSEKGVIGRITVPTEVYHLSYVVLYNKSELSLQWNCLLISWPWNREIILDNLGELDSVSWMNLEAKLRFRWERSSSASGQQLLQAWDLQPPLANCLQISDCLALSHNCTSQFLVINLLMCKT